MIVKPEAPPCLIEQQHRLEAEPQTMSFHLAFEWQLLQNDCTPMLNHSSL
uniref:Uncharacterized protein n=1 Tax=Arundo donax TaxID=35708 RepID=A0A0A9SX73_ARUDO